MKKDQIVWGLITAKNEAKTIEDVVRRTKKYVNQVLVVNDGSTDLTLPNAAAGGAVVISHPFNLGKGAAIRSGWLWLAWTQNLRPDDLIVSLDADGQHNPDDIPLLLNQIGKYDMVIGSRDLSPYPFYKRMGNKFLSGLASMLSKQGIKDGECGFRCMRYEILTDLLKVINAQYYEIEMEINVVAGQMGYKIGSVPVKSTMYRKGVTFRSGIKNAYAGVKTWAKIKTGWLQW